MIKFTFSLPVNETDLDAAVARLLRVKLKGKTEILKKSLDARDKGKLKYLYTVAAETEETEKALRHGGVLYEKPDYSIEKLLDGRRYEGQRPVVVGTGPCGLFAALALCKAGAKPIILERGDPVEVRRKKADEFNERLILDTESNIQFGEGGAGTFSDGKLNTGVSGPVIPIVLSEFVRHGAPEEVAFLNKPHVGTDYLAKVVAELRRELLSYGAEIRFRTKLTDIKLRNGKVVAAVTDKETFDTDRIYLAIGHSARDTFEMLYAKGVVMTSKIFSMGVRIEHLQQDIDFAQYGRKRGTLPPADYKAAVKLSGGNSLYTFCMCPGGTVVNASSEEGAVCVNGMSNFARDGINANSALLVNVTEREFGEKVLGGMEFQRKVERACYRATGSYKAAVQRYGDFVGKRTGGKISPTVSTGFTETDLRSFLPSFICDGLAEGIPIIARKIRNFDDPDAVLTAVESRSSSPVRILRDENYRSSVEGLIPLGEGAGYAGGITSAAADGIKGVLATLS